MSRRPRQVSIAGALIIIAALAVLLNFCIVPVGRRMEWSALAGQIDARLRNLQPSRPAPGYWNEAHGWVITAYFNICFSPEHTSTAEMYRLRDDLEQKLEQDVDVETLKWIWKRLGETGPHGQRYTKRYEQAFRECLPPESR